MDFSFAAAMFFYFISGSLNCQYQFGAEKEMEEIEYQKEILNAFEI